jgi:hypothetical protein
MIFLSAKARRIVEDAVQRLPDPRDRQAWADWSRAHPAVKQWDSPAGSEPLMPPHIAAVAASALSRLAASLEGDIYARTSDDDELVQLDNTLAYVRSIERTLAHPQH